MTTRSLISTILLLQATVVAFGADPLPLAPYYHVVRTANDVEALPQNAGAIRGEDINDEAAIAIAKRSPHTVTLEWLDDYRPSPISDEAIDAIAAIPTLRSLELSFHERLTPAAFAAIAKSSVETLSVDQLTLTDKHLEALGDSSSLRRVDLMFHRKVTPSGVEGLLNAPALRSLGLTGPVGSDHLAAIAESELVSIRISLSEENATQTLAGLTGPPTLQSLGLDGSTSPDLRPGVALPSLTGFGSSFCWNLSPTSIGTWIESIAPLTSLDISHCTLDRSTNRILSKLRDLESLSIDGCRDLDPDSIAELIAKNKLVALSMNSSMTDDPVILKQVAKSKALRKLSVRSNAAIDDKRLGSFTKLRQLEELAIGGSQQITDNGIKAIARLSTVRALDLSYLSKVTDKSVAALARMKGLEQIDVSGTAMTSRGVETLRKKLGGCDVVFRLVADENTDS